jgi:hypothetical protein
MTGCIGSSGPESSIYMGLRMEILHNLSCLATKTFRQFQMGIIAVQNPAVLATSHLPESPSRNSPSNSYQWALYQESEHSHRAMDPNPVKVSFLLVALSAVACTMRGGMNRQFHTNVGCVLRRGLTKVPWMMSGVFSHARGTSRVFIASTGIELKSIKGGSVLFRFVSPLRSIRLKSYALTRNSTSSRCFCRTFCALVINLFMGRKRLPPEPSAMCFPTYSYVPSTHAQARSTSGPSVCTQSSASVIARLL